MIRWRIRNRIRELFWLPPLPPPTGEAVPPRPRVELALDRCVPGPVVRLVPATLVLAVTAVVGDGSGFWWVLAAAIAALITVVPRGQFAAGFALLVGVWVFVGGDLLAPNPATDALDQVWRVSVAVLGVHAVIAASALANHVGWRALVEVGVLWRTVRSVIGAQTIAQTLVLLAAWLRAGLTGADSQELVRLIGLIAVLGLASWVLPLQWRRGRAVRSVD